MSSINRGRTFRREVSLRARDVFDATTPSVVVATPRRHPPPNVRRGGGARGREEAPNVSPGAQTVGCRVMAEAIHL